MTTTTETTVSQKFDGPSDGQNKGDKLAQKVGEVSAAELHAGVGAANRASVEAPEHWQARALELLSESHGPDVAAAIVARVAALTAFLGEGPNPGAYEGHGAFNVLPGLFQAAVSCEVNERGRFDRRAIDALCGCGAEAAA